ncbi:hypothetical protein GCM10009779_66170 [Polymorphospora rubra]|uniref:Uncharacterized protein n=1 Tax=Polymorphospora rubra TaxID=338584 RepID=A0A810MUC8_9ACTN|nr:hypothetical protein Prubr_18370 [Polymorphospora rubra]
MIEARDYPQPSVVFYCKQIGGRASHARVSSRSHAVYVQKGPAGSGVEVVLRASARDGTTCVVDAGGK